jgi:phospholipase/carboxylesterase
MAYTYTINVPEKVKAVAGLAGFLPDGVYHTNDDNFYDFSTTKVYISHGTKDAIVPIDKAYEAARFFQDQGAEVTFCESDVGHKLNADCFKGLEVFFT